MKKEELELLNSLCKKAYAKGAATQFMLRGLNKDQTKAATIKTASAIDNLQKIASYRREVIKSAIRSCIAK